MKGKGPESYLSADVEQWIVSWISHMADIRSGQTKNDILDKVQVLVNRLNLETPWPTGWPSDKWYWLFMGQYPLLQYCMVLALSKEQAGVMYDHLYVWFLELRAYCTSLGEHTIFEDVTHIYNCNEICFPLAPKPWKVLVNIRNIKHHYQARFTNAKAQITVLLCSSASGHYTNPLVIYPGVKPHNELCNHFHEMFEEGLFGNLESR